MNAKSLAANISARLKKFSAAEINQLIGAFCAVTAIFYGLLVWYPDHKKLGDLTYKQQKLDKRKKTSGGEIKLPDIAKAAGMDPQKIKEESEKVAASIAHLESEKTRLEKRFVPLDNLDSLQSLKSEITRLAETGDMEVVSLEHIYKDKDDRERPPTPERLKAAGEANPYHRPLLKMKSRASYRGLMQFLDGLSKLAFIAAPVWVDIGVGIEKKDNRAVRQWLEVEIHLAV
ncbi:MAG: hypothetical protein LBG78_08510 [Azoarcus sp.]|nr:hypothetical protein [Azoarcus sp.]